MNYRDLLIRYIDHVGQCEGTEFLTDSYRLMSELTDEEWDELVRLSRSIP
jgi:hypothetical protein